MPVDNFWPVNDVPRLSLADEMEKKKEKKRSRINVSSDRSQTEKYPATRLSDWIDENRFAVTDAGAIKKTSGK